MSRNTAYSTLMGELRSQCRTSLRHIAQRVHHRRDPWFEKEWRRIIDQLQELGKDARKAESADAREERRTKAAAETPPPPAAGEIFADWTLAGDVGAAPSTAQNEGGQQQ